MAKGRGPHTCTNGLNGTIPIHANGHVKNGYSNGVKKNGVNGKNGKHNHLVSEINSSSSNLVKIEIARIKKNKTERK